MHAAGSEVVAAAVLKAVQGRAIVQLCCLFTILICIGTVTSLLVSGEEVSRFKCVQQERREWRRATGRWAAGRRSAD